MTPGSLRIGSLFSGYGGLDIGVIAALGGGTVAWHCEFADSPARILAHQFPGIPNHVDVTTVDWSQVAPIDVLTGGFPCQDVSLAGARAGLREGTRSGLWSYFAAAIDALKPSLVVIENVRGLLSAVAGDKKEFTDEEVSELESVKGTVGGLGRSDRPVLRALGAVLGNLAELGYDAEWCGLRAADAGATHNRFRVFILAYPRSEAGNLGAGLRESRPAGIRRGRPDDDSVQAPVTDARSDGLGRDTERDSEPQQPGLEAPRRVHADGRATADTDSAGRGEHGGAIPIREEHPAAEHGGTTDRGGATVAPDARSERFGEHPGESPTEEARAASSDVADGASGLRPHIDWGPYLPAVTRWEELIGRPAPEPTKPDGRNGNRRLSAEFVEWMMGLSAGHVTNPAIWAGMTASGARNAQLKALGNGVVPQQAALAVSILLERVSA